MTEAKKTGGRPPKPEGAKSGAERARAFRAAHKPVSIQVSARLAAHLKMMREKSGWTTEEIITRAVNTLILRHQTPRSTARLIEFEVHQFIKDCRWRFEIPPELDATAHTLALSYDRIYGSTDEDSIRLGFTRDFEVANRLAPSAGRVALEAVYRKRLGYELDSRALEPDPRFANRRSGELTLERWREEETDDFKADVERAMILKEQAYDECMARGRKISLAHGRRERAETRAKRAKEALNSAPPAPAADTSLPSPPAPPKPKRARKPRI